MPGPPPPPPPGAPPPPVMAFSSASSLSGGPDDRSALLSSIRKGAKLKKTVTNDKSGPFLGNKPVSRSQGGSPNPSFRGNNGTGGGGGAAVGVPNGLGDLFAGGIPKLKPVNKNGGGSINSVNSSKTPESPSPKSFNSIQSELKKQMASDGRNLNRGPPPPAPVRSFTTTDDSPSRHFGSRNGSGNSNGFHQNPSLPNLTSPHQGAYHRKTNSNISLSTTVDSIDSTSNNNPRPVINHGKPNLAPKPPILNGKPAAPPKKLIIKGKPVSRAQSMRSPRSPSPQNPDNNNADFGAKFGTVRNLSHVLNQNLGQSLGNLSQVKARPPLNGRPTAPPPSVPNTAPPPPPSKTMKPPNHAPPPPPTAIPQAPNHAPPPPPHRTGPQVPARAPPSVPNNVSVPPASASVPPTVAAPPPPPRHSSIRDSNNGTGGRKGATGQSVAAVAASLESRFAFHSVSEFPRPMPFRGVLKVYTSRQVGGKQQAPPPPVTSQIQLSNRLWESSTC